MGKATPRSELFGGGGGGGGGKPDKMGLEVDSEAVSEIKGDIDGGESDGDGGGESDYGKSGTIGPDGLDLDLGGRNTCGDGSHGNGVKRHDGCGGRLRGRFGSSGGR
jgi:hypothetical protein